MAHEKHSLNSLSLNITENHTRYEVSSTGMGLPERPATKNVRKQQPKKSKTGNRLGLIQNLVVVF
jgi:hypothetical protein